MPPTPLALPQETSEALRVLKEASLENPSWVFKRSPTCPISHRAEALFEEWLASEERPFGYAYIDVIEQRTLARGLTEELGITHQSPQVLLFEKGELVWHESHMQIHLASLTKAFEGALERATLEG